MSACYHNGVMELTEAQQRALDKMREYRVVAILENGAVLVARSSEDPKPKVIDTDGTEFSFRQYLTDRDKRSW